MTNFDILSTEQLLNVKGGANEMTSADIADEAIV